MSNILPLLFAPSFLVSIRYFDFKSVVLVYLAASIALFVYGCYRRKKADELGVVAIYSVFLAVAYFSSAVEWVKLIPAFTALMFFAVFAQAAIRKQGLILRFSQRFYKGRFSPSEIEFLKKGDTFWAFAILLYALFLLLVTFFGSDVLWAFFSSIGWYLYFVSVLSAQILYGRFRGVRR